MLGSVADADLGTLAGVMPVLASIMHSVLAHLCGQMVYPGLPRSYFWCPPSVCSAGILLGLSYALRISWIYPWRPPGALLGLSWISPGALLGLSWGSPGPLLGLSWDSPGALLGLAWASPGFSWGSPGAILGLLVKHSVLKKGQGATQAQTLVKQSVLATRLT